VSFHFTPISDSWMHILTLWLSIQQFVWTRTARQILDKATKRQGTSDALPRKCRAVPPFRGNGMLDLRDGLLY
jgi:hypothetical protein